MTVDDIARLMAHPDAAEVRIVDMVQDVPSHLAAADAVVCMGGYNTMCEVLATSAPAVVVPRVSPRLEQLMRSERFASLGLVSTLHPRLLSPDILARAVLDVSQQAGTVRVRGGTRLAGVAHGGVGVAAALLDALLPVAVSR
jgi:predicted glycosyltransferase